MMFMWSHLPKAQNMLFPAIEDVILGVDLEKREIQVRPPEWS